MHSGVCRARARSFPSRSPACSSSSNAANRCAVLLLQVGRAAVAEHEEVAAEAEVMAELLYSDLGAWHRLALRIPHCDHCVALAMLFDARAGFGEDTLIARFSFLLLTAPGGTAEQQSRSGGPGFEECSSIHRDSKQQRGTLLKPKSVCLNEGSLPGGRASSRALTSGASQTYSGSRGRSPSQ